MAVTLFSTLLWSLVIAVPILYAVIALIRIVRIFKRRVKYIDKLPGVKPHWLFGTVHEFPGATEVGLKWMKYHSNEVDEGIASFWFGPFLPSVAVFHPDTVKAILKTSEPKPKAIGGYFMLEPWLGDGLLLSRGTKWARNRRLLTPAFHFDILRPYMDVNNRCVDVFLNKLEQFAARGEFVETFSHISLLTLDIILRCAFSYENDCQLRGHPWLYPHLVFNLTKRGREFRKNSQFVHQISDEIINKRQRTLNQDGEKILKDKGRYLDFLDVLLTARDENGTGLTHQEIRDEVDTFLFEGHDTTASGISWALWSLAANPQHQEKCQQEVDEIIGQRSNKDIEWDDLPKLKYLTACIKESLRIHTVVPFIERQTTQDMFIEGYFIPAGTLVDIQLYALHHNERIWKNSYEYLPERFLDDAGNEMSHFSFVPFSAGPRNCIGQHFAMHEMKTIIARILSRFTLHLDPDRPTEHRIIVVMKTESGMYIKATPRTHTE